MKKILHWILGVIGIVLLIIVGIVFGPELKAKIKNPNVVFISSGDSAFTTTKYAIKSYVTRGDDYYCKQFARPYMVILPEPPVEDDIVDCSRIAKNLRLLDEAHKTADSGLCMRDFVQPVNYSDEDLYGGLNLLCKRVAGLKLDDEDSYFDNIVMYILGEVDPLHMYYNPHSPNNLDEYNMRCNFDPTSCDEYTKSVYGLIKYYKLLLAQKSNP